ncbi:PAS domain S-box protein [Limnofasciculus baicalensis]|uniref:Circadian input-output histidine kinase CikA n=1 Tax=Limnofasciculus baicalensis BBK-W-15 TaxID=2699891 RepID=A0AAE3GPP5_9CYAN|nr:PAS domain S-box protein [Limnofasciculus baicalensis]MCP2727548.1 PAS domain S-box protein [Limnofasciculus baicalensis BBK-W-15]
MNSNPAKILIVDDHPNNLRFLSKILNDRGYKTQRAICGQLALNAVKESPPDLIVLDIMMPNMNGYEVCNRLKSNSNTRDIPIIFLSALNQTIDKVKAFEIGGIDYITKPFQVEEILARIENQLTIQNLSRQLQAQNDQLQQEVDVRKQAEIQLKNKSQILAQFSANLKKLHHLNTKSHNNIEDIFADYLQTGCDILGFSTGIISQIENQDYKIIAVRSNIQTFKINESFNLSDTYCSPIIKLKKTIAYAHIGKIKEIKSSPICQDLKLESYLGSPIFVDGKIYGTINFLSLQIRHQKFNNREKELIELMAESLGRVISKNQEQMKRQQAEERLRLLERAIAVANNGIIITDAQAADRPVVYVNSGFERITGYTREELIGKNTRFLQRQDTKQPVINKLRRTIAEGGEGQFILRNYRKDGSLFWNELSITPVRDVMGKLTHYIGVQTDITQRKLAEEALKKSEERWQLVLEGNNDGIFDWNIKTNEAFISARLQQMLGYADREINLHFHQWQSNVHPEDLDRVIKNLRTHLNKKSKLYIDEYRLRCKNGTYKWVLVRGQTLYEEGKAQRMVGSLQDITLRKQAEERIRTSEQKLSFLLQNAPLAIIEWNNNGEVMAWNQAAESIFGYSATEIIGSQGFSLIVPENNKVEIYQTWQTLLTQQGGYHNIIENLTKGGKNIICEWYNAPLLDRHGSAFGCASIAVDITERKHSEWLDKVQKTVLEMVTKGRSLHDVLLEMTHQVDCLTPQMYSSILLMQDDGQHLRPFVSPQIPSAFVEAIDPLLIGPMVGCCGTTAYFGKRTIVEDIANSPLWLELRDLALSYKLRACWSEPILSDKGKVLGTFALYFTEVRSPEPRELEVIESLARLASLVIQRKQAEEALEQAKEVAEMANRSKSDFLASMSHELRTPLNAILGFSQILAYDESLSLEQRKHLGIINRSGEHLLELINDVLSMSKIEAGRIGLNETCFDLHWLLDSLEEMLRLKANSKGLQLIFERDFAIPQYICTDESKLRQVLINLLGNAIKFTQKGHVILRAGADNRKEKITKNNQQITNNKQQRTITFEVEDTGSGIAQNELNKLFNPFVQTNTGHQSMEGTGLGLAISRQFVLLMGGDITVESILDRGSIFRFNILVDLAKAEDIETKVSQERVIGLEANQPKYRILIVEDILENRQLLLKMLSHLDFEICEAVNGEEAVSLSESWQPHLILMDICMPVMDGYEATKQIKQFPNSRNTAIIALTASAFEEQRQAILDAGCDDFIRKPFREEILLKKISHYLGVRYVYKNENQANLIPKSLESLRLTKKDFSGMSDSWIKELYQAAIAMDDQLASELIRQIPEREIALAKILTNLIDNFRLDVIVDCIDVNSVHE